MQNVKKTTLSTALGSLLVVSAPFMVNPASADVEISGNLTLASDYFFRGYSETDNGPAIQGGFDLEHSSGLYAGTWASNVAFAKGSEVDFYAGYTTDLTDEIFVDVGALYYVYAGDSDANTAEIYVGAGYSWFSLYYSHAVTDFFGDDGRNSYYFDFGVEVPMTAELTGVAHVGYQKVKVSGASDESFTDWSIGLEYAFNDTYSIGGYYYDVNDSDYDDSGRFVAAIHASF